VLTVADPAIVTQPVGEHVDLGSSFSVTVSAVGDSSLSYQWYLNGLPISGATSPTYTVISAHGADAGSYTVKVTDTAGNITSNAAVVAVVDPVITVQPASKTVSGGDSVTFTVTASGETSLTYQWYLNGSPISGATASSYSIASAQSFDAGSYSVKITDTAGSVTSAAAVLTVVGAPVVTTQPASQTVNAGSDVTLTVAASGPAFTYQWYFNGTAIPGATSSSLTVSTISTIQAGSYTVQLTNSYGTTTSSAANVGVNYNARLTNLSARANVLTGNNVLIAGFVIGGTATKQVLLRGIGPGLDYAFPGAFSAGETLSAPVLTLTNPATGATLATNSAWGSGSTPPSTLMQVFSQFGAFGLQSGSNDGVLLQTLGTGAGVSSYTSQVSGAGGATGVALAEIYDADSGSPTSRLINISARADVLTGDKILIGGFVIGGTTPETVLIRAIGPGLDYAFPGAFQAGSTMANPVLSLYDSNGAVIATDTGWGNAIVAGTSTVHAGLLQASAATMASVGAYALQGGSADSAMVVTLPPGGYTAQVKGLNGTTGIAVVEIYEVP
jgi:plastocyanin